jgi:polysaccharide export outer membrane protein
MGTGIAQRRRLMQRGSLSTLAAMLLLCASVLAAEPGGEQTEKRHLSLIEAGDQVTIQVYGQPDMESTVSVSDDGNIRVPLAGPVHVAGMTPVQAGMRVEAALMDGQFLVNPHVTITVVQPLSQRVSVLGEVRTPGRYAIAPNTTIFDLLAQAGGVTDNGGDVVYIQRAAADGKLARMRVEADQAATQTVQGGDSVIVPIADQFYIYGEVTNPGKYRIEHGMTVIQAIARAGGITPRGSDRRVDIKRATGTNGEYAVRRAKASDLIEPNDVVNVKESIF